MDSGIEARLLRAYKKLLPVGDSFKTSSGYGDFEFVHEQNRIDKIAVAQILDLFRPLSAVKKEQFLSVLENPVFKMTNVKEGASGEGFGMGDANAQLTANYEAGLTLYFDFLARHLLIGRIFLIHELSHLSRFVYETSSHEELARHVIKLFDKKFFRYSEEVRAFRAQYKFLRSAYTAESLQHLKSILVSEVDPTIESQLIAAGFLRYGRDKSGAITSMHVKFDGESKELGLVYWFNAIKKNEQFIAMVTQALEMSEAHYVHDHLELYEQDQFEDHLLGLKKRFIRFIKRLPADDESY